jgi:hypothetical protein
MSTDPAERRKTYLKRKKSGLCPRCGQKVKKSSKFKTCDDCREYYRNYNREIAESVQEIRRERYEQRKAKNCCPRCNIFLGKKSKNTICSKCLDKQYQYSYGKKRGKK